MDPLERLVDRALSYREIGATGRELPDDARHVARDRRIGSGRSAFEAVAEHLVTWGLHRSAGLQVSASAPRAAMGVDLLLSFGPAWLPISAPCRVVHTVDQEDRIGFTYGTLDGNPMSGEESFSVLLTPDGDVRFVLIAFSRPASSTARLGGVIGRRLADRVTDRYVTAAERIAASI